MSTIGRLHRFLPWAGLLFAAALPARAEFYDLNGRYECLAAPDKVCYDATPSQREWAPTPEAPAPTTAPTTAPGPAAPEKSAKSAKPAKDAKAAVGKPVRSQGSDPLPEIGARLQARKPEEGDIATLQARARTGDARALEMLAWCSYVGVGVPRDPVRAYFLYGQAAAAGARTGRESQAMVFKRGLSPEQRQQVLQTENGGRSGQQAPTLR